MASLTLSEQIELSEALVSKMGDVLGAEGTMILRGDDLRTVMELLQSSAARLREDDEYDDDDEPDQAMPDQPALGLSG